MSMGKGDTPPAPNYAAAAQAQGQANVEAARLGSKLSNPNIYTPLGNRTVTWGTGPVFDQAGYDQAMKDYNSGQGSVNGGLPSWINGGDTSGYGNYGNYGNSGGGQAPTRDQFTSYGNTDQANVNINLSPDQQKLFDTQNKLSQGLLNLGQGSLNQVSNNLSGSLDTSGLAPQVQSVYGYGGPMPQAGRLGYMGNRIQQNVDGGPIQGNVNIPGLGNVENALYSRATARLDPQWGTRQSQLETQLTNQGLRPGTEAWTNAMRDFNFGRNDAYSSAMNDAIAAGGAEQSRQFGLNLGQGQFFNQAQNQGFGQGLANAGLWNQGQGQAFSQGLAGQGQGFNQGLAAGQFQNTSRQGGLQEALALRQLPLSEFNAIRSGAQPQMPQFQPYQGQNVNPAPIFAGAQAQGQADINAYNANMGQNNAFTSGLFGLGGSIAGKLPWASILGI